MKKIYYRSDSSGWVQSNRLHILKKYLASEYHIINITNTFFLRFFLGKSFLFPCYFASWRQILINDLWKKIPLELCMASVSSHYNIGGGLNPKTSIGKNQTDEKKVFDKAIAVLSKFKVATANSLILYNMLRPFLENLVYAPNGVDENFFITLRNKTYNKHNIRIGWIGKIKAAKNYKLIERLKPVFIKTGIEFKEIALQKNSKKVLSKEEIRDFYHSIDYYLCTSWHEGTPNPCLEAASCGTPLITTRVGNMPELIKDSINGFFIEPFYESVVNILEKIKQEVSKEDYYKMSENIREEIVKNWSWEKQINNYRKAFEKLLYG